MAFLAALGTLLNGVAHTKKVFFEKEHRLTSELKQQNQFSASFLLPAFPTGSAEPDETLRCAINEVATKLSSTPEIYSIVLVGSADKRKLLSNAKRKYSSNMGLAQHRGAYVEKIFRSIIVGKGDILVVSAGPLLTNTSIRDADLDADRAVRVLIRGYGKAPEWITKLRVNPGWSSCK